MTGFHVGTLDLNSLRWWEALTRQSAESRNVRPGIGQLVEFGTLEGRTVQLQIQPGRIDWWLLPKEEPESVKFASLGDYGDALSYFSQLIFKWVEQAPPLNRLAFGALLLIPTANQSESIDELAKMLPDVIINWAGINEFVLQVNRPQTSAVFPEAGPINRVAKWQTLIRKKIMASPMLGGQAPVTTSEEMAACLELDISTIVPTEGMKELPSERLKQLFEELMDYGTAIASKRALL
jgi:hypothetical protein